MSKVVLHAQAGNVLERLTPLQASEYIEHLLTLALSGEEGYPECWDLNAGTALYVARQLTKALKDTGGAL